MKEDKVVIPKDEYIRLKRKAKIADDAIVQLGLSLEDIKKGRIVRVS